MYNPPFSINDTARETLSFINERLCASAGTSGGCTPLTLEHILRTHAAAGFDGRLRETPPAPHSVPVLLNALLQWLNSTPVHPLIRYAVFCYELVSIHPFAAGNEEVALLLYAELLHSYHPALSKRTGVEISEALRCAQNEENCSQFIQESLCAILAVLRRTPEKRTIHRHRAVSTGIDTLADFIQQHPGCKRQDILAALPGLSARMLDRHLQNLREQGVVEYRGSRKTGAYFPAQGRLFI
jgi:Fic family protein